MSAFVAWPTGVGSTSHVVKLLEAMVSVLVLEESALEPQGDPRQLLGTLQFVEFC